MANKAVLLIAYRFSPRHRSASLRLRGLAKYLPEFGWEPLILTAALPGLVDPCFRVIETPYPGDVSARLKRRFGLDPRRGFQEQVGIPSSIRESRRSPFSRLVRPVQAIVTYPDEQRAWRVPAVKVGAGLLKKEKISALLSSSTPVTAHAIAHDLKREFGLPWLADLRDLWTQNHNYPYGPVRRVVERSLERRTLGSADGLVTVSAPLARTLQTLHPRKPVSSIPNGFDPDEVVPPPPLDLEFSITYTGQLYQGRQDPSLLFRSLRELLEQSLLDPVRVRVRFFGPCPDWLRKCASLHGVSDLVELRGQVPREEALRRQRTSQLLLLLNWSDPRERGVYTGKVFEYLAARRPILAIGGPRGVVSDLLEETEAGHHTSNLSELKAVILHHYHYYLGSGATPYEGNEAQLNRHTHREMAKAFAEALDSIVERKGARESPT